MVRKGTCTAWYQDTVCRCTSENKSGVMLTQVTGTCWWSSEISIARTGAGSQNSLASFVYCLLPNESHFLSLNFLTEKTERWICVNPGDHVTLTTVAIKISTTPTRTLGLLHQFVWHSRQYLSTQAITRCLPNTTDTTIFSQNTL